MSSITNSAELNNPRKSGLHGSPNTKILMMYWAILIFPLWANRRARKRFSRKLRATIGTPSRMLDLFSTYIKFYLFIYIGFTIYWAFQLYDTASCLLDENCMVDYFKGQDIGFVEFWYSFLLDCYVSMAWFFGEVKSHWTPVPYWGNVTNGLYTTIYNGHTRTIYFDGTTTVLTKGMSSTVYLPKASMTMTESTTVSTIVSAIVTATVSKVLTKTVPKIVRTTVSTTVLKVVPTTVSEVLTKTIPTTLTLTVSEVLTTTVPTIFTLTVSEVLTTTIASYIYTPSPKTDSKTIDTTRDVTTGGGSWQKNRVPAKENEQEVLISSSGARGGDTVGTEDENMDTRDIKDHNSMDDFEENFEDDDEYSDDDYSDDDEYPEDDEHDNAYENPDHSSYALGSQEDEFVEEGHTFDHECRSSCGHEARRAN